MLVSIHSLDTWSN